MIGDDKSTAWMRFLMPIDIIFKGVRVIGVLLVGRGDHGQQAATGVW